MNLEQSGTYLVVTGISGNLVWESFSRKSKHWWSYDPFHEFVERVCRFFSQVLRGSSGLPLLKERIKRFRNVRIVRDEPPVDITKSQKGAKFCLSFRGLRLRKRSGRDFVHIKCTRSDDVAEIFHCFREEPTLSKLQRYACLTQYVENSLYVSKV